MQSILTIEQVSKKFENTSSILQGIDVTFEAESFITILGPSGSGKTTLLHIIAGLLKPTSGKVLYKNEDITAFSEKKLAHWKRAEVGTIFQNYLLLNNLTVRENINIGIDSKSTPLPFDRLIRILDIENILDKFPSQLSGGQQQRVAIARAVIKKPSILFCDEATGALDEMNSKNVVELLHQLKRTFGITILFTTHNMQIARTADRVITLKDGILFRDTINQHPISAVEMVWGE